MNIYLYLPASRIQLRTLARFCFKCLPRWNNASPRPRPRNPFCSFYGHWARSADARAIRGCKKKKQREREREGGRDRKGKNDNATRATVRSYFAIREREQLEKEKEKKKERERERERKREKKTAIVIAFGDEIDRCVNPAIRWRVYRTFRYYTTCSFANIGETGWQPNDIDIDSQQTSSWFLICIISHRG